ncbi:28S ribosomal protein S18b [Sarcoptes scabiei]|uniref:Small ribosomal subunit protein mS40 n=1 Tax=Sarcoptes scabiei TaxID=52283 RepID=A0A834VCD5_SARSC|nr:28S ribosomal protein S18b [Sarcoptes scabiei]
MFYLERPKRPPSKNYLKDPTRDRRTPIDVETSIKYLNSEAFKETYQNYKVWEVFRRNFRGQYSPVVPRLSCLDEGFVKTSNPCPICRDRYLVLHYTNLQLLAHFISPQTGYVYPNSILCLCAEQYEKLCVAITLAKNHGLIDFEVPIRNYDYFYYYKDKLPKNFQC